MVVGIDAGGGAVDGAVAHGAVQAIVGAGGVGAAERGGTGQPLLLRGAVERVLRGDDTAQRVEEGHAAGGRVTIAVGRTVGRNAILQVRDLDEAIVCAGAIVDGNDVVYIPAIIVARAIAVGIVLQGVGSAAEIIARTAGVSYLEAGLIGLAGSDLANAQIRNVFGEKLRVVLRVGNEYVADVVHAADGVPRRGATGAAAGIFIGGDRTQ